MKRPPKGMPTVSFEWLAARVRIEEGHWIWTGYLSEGHPKSNLGVRSDNKPVNVRRVVWVSMGWRLKPSQLVTNACEVAGCVAPHCLEQRRHGARNKGRKQTLTAIVNNARARRRFSPEQVADMRTGRMTQAQFAVLYDCSQSMVGLIQRGVYYQDLSNNPFAALRLGLRSPSSTP